MAGRENQKLKLIYILDILKKYSDEEHPLNANDIADKLTEYDITAERKSIYNDIAYLEQYGCDIIKATKPQRGWFIGDREFEVAEVYLLCDAVRSAKFISGKKTRELLHKLNQMLSVYQAKRWKNSVFFSMTDKTTNEELYYNIDKISNAIENKKQIKFEYSSRAYNENREITRKAKQMTINPYALTWQDDHYYLIGNYSKYDNLLHLRLDRINSVDITDTPARHFSEVCEYKDFFDIADYTKKIFGMHSGELYDVELCCDKKITEQVVDRFSENIFITKVTDNTFNFTVKAALSEGLVTWIMNYGDELKVVKPDILKEKICDRAKKVLEIYGNDKL